MRVRVRIRGRDEGESEGENESDRWRLVEGMRDRLVIIPVNWDKLPAVESLELKGSLHVLINVFVEEVNQGLITRLGGDPARDEGTPAKILDVEVDHTRSRDCVVCGGKREREGEGSQCRYRCKQLKRGGERGGPMLTHTHADSYSC